MNEIQQPLVKRFPTIWAIVITVVLTAVIVGGGVYLWQSSVVNSLQGTAQKLEQQIGDLQSQVAELQQPLETEGEYVTCNNSNFYEFSYKKGWHVYINNGIEPAKIVMDKGPIWEGETENLYPVEIRVKSQHNKTLSDAVKDFIGDDRVLKTEDVTVAGYPAKRFEHLGFGGAAVSYIFVTPTQAYHILFRPEVGLSEIKEPLPFEMLHIVDSFRTK